MAESKPVEPPVPEEAIRFLERKVNVETEKWDDLKWGEHAHGFTVAHSLEAGVLDTLHALMNKAASDGISFGEFRKSALAMMADKKWYGGGGHTADDKGYINWRLKVMYETNMRTAYSAARYRRQLESAETRPVWVYHHSPAVASPREEHLALDGRAYRYDDRFWDTYYPPNGWGCQCYVTTESERGAERDGIDVSDSTGEALPEIDPTWAYNVGREALAPNFAKYAELKKAGQLGAVQRKYRADMDLTRMSYGQMETLLTRMRSKEYGLNKKKALNYQAGNLDERRVAALGVDDSKVMITEERIYHAFRDKGKATIPDDCAADAYAALSRPDVVYEEKRTRHGEPGRVFHFVKRTKRNKVINVVVRWLKGCAMKVTTIDLADPDTLKTVGDLKEVWK